MLILQILLGFALLVVGAELLVKGAVQIAQRFSISPLIIGLTVVAFGTSMPELAVSLIATIEGMDNVAVANVVGSNIFNVLAILGISALIIPLKVDVQLIRRDVPLMILLSAIVWGFALNGAMSRWIGLFLFSLVMGFTVYTIRAAKRVDFGESPETSGNGPDPIWKSTVWVLLGLIMLVVGSRVLVKGAVSMAESLGISDFVIGATIVAAGTSLPELATSVMAAIRGQRDIAVGNVIGSNIFNITAILGLSAIFSGSEGLGVESVAIFFDLPFMLVSALLCLPIVLSGHVISRWEGFVLLLFFIFYILCSVNVIDRSGAVSLITGAAALVFLSVSTVSFAFGTLRARRRR